MKLILTAGIMMAVLATAALALWPRFSPSDLPPTASDSCVWKTTAGVTTTVNGVAANSECWQSVYSEAENVGDVQSATFRTPGYLANNFVISGQVDYIPAIGDPATAAYVASH